MRLEINIGKKHFFMIFGALIILAGVIFVVGQGNVPNPGHSLNEIGYVGEVIDWVEDINVNDKIIHKGDTDTYIDFNTNEIKLVTSGNTRVVVESGGDVDVKKNLDVDGSVCFNGNDCIDSWSDVDGGGGGGGGSQVAEGIYSGAGGEQSINVGFRPSTVLIMKAGVLGGEVDKWFFKIDSMDDPSFTSVNFNSVSVAHNVEIDSNGFNVIGNANSNSGTYYYTAWE